MCLCSSSHLGRARTAHIVAADQARACARLPVLAGATWSCAWLLPACAGSAPRHHPLASNYKGELGQPSMAGALSCHAPPASPESSTMWSSGRTKRAGRCAASCRSGSTPLPGLSRVRGCRVVAGQRAKRKMKQFFGRQPARCLHLV